MTNPKDGDICRLCEIDDRLHPVPRFRIVVAVAGHRYSRDDRIEDQQHNVADGLRLCNEGRHIGCGIEWPRLAARRPCLFDKMDVIEVRAHADQARDKCVGWAIFGSPYKHIAGGGSRSVRPRSAG